jgi:hypothetical protein
MNPLIPKDYINSKTIHSFINVMGLGIETTDRYHDGPVYHSPNLDQMFRLKFYQDFIDPASFYHFDIPNYAQAGLVNEVMSRTCTKELWKEKLHQWRKHNYQMCLAATDYCPFAILYTNPSTGRLEYFDVYKTRLEALENLKTAPKGAFIKETPEHDDANSFINYAERQL